MKCLWCKCETTTIKEDISDHLKLADREHIFPESVEGKACLDVGKVCKGCNNSFATIDNDLRDKNTMMTKQFQDASHIQGKPIGKNRGKADRERKEAMVKNIAAFNGGTKIDRGDDFHNIKFTNLAGGTGDEPYNRKFSRALHKCAVNALYDQCDYDDMRPQFDDLIEFVRTGDADYRDWSYGVCYANPFQFAAFEPWGWIFAIGGKKAAVILFLPALIAVVGLYPKLLQPHDLENHGNDLIKSQMESLKMDTAGFITRYNGGIFNSAKRFGANFGFLFRKCLIDPRTRQDGDFHVLFNCDVCGQINPSMFFVSKHDVLVPRSSHTAQSSSKGWNVITKDDLRAQGIQVDKWESEALERLLRQPFNYPADREFINKDAIRNCSSQCINCGAMVTFSGEDLFI